MIRLFVTGVLFVDALLGAFLLAIMATLLGGSDSVIALAFLGGFVWLMGMNGFVTLMLFVVGVLYFAHGGGA